MRLNFNFSEPHAFLTTFLGIVKTHMVPLLVHQVLFSLKGNALALLNKAHVTTFHEWIVRINFSNFP